MDQQDFQTFYKETNTLLFGYLMRLCENRSLSEEIIQETYLTFLKKPPREKHFKAWKSYLYKIATRNLADHFRMEVKKRKAIIEMSSTTTLVDQEPGEGQDPDVIAAIRELSQHEKSLLWLAYVEGYEHGEIAEIMGLRPKSVRVLLFRARQKVKELLSKNQVNDEE